ncbi:MAG: hypothetical protein FJZ38_10035 [Candidatus Rokubacteria bacterium]|nr:hypothetical protein [Candidatus Rokubacteria bacterium]
MNIRKVAAGAAVTMLVLGPGPAAMAQPRTPDKPGRTPDDVVPVLEAWRDEPKSKSDAHRLVGKVLAVDQQRGTVKLSTDTEGVRDVKPHAMLLRAVRVGDTISVARAPDDAVSASPR